MAGHNLDEIVSRKPIPLQSGEAGALLILMVAAGTWIFVTLALPGLHLLVRLGLCLLAVGVAARFVWQARMQKRAELLAIQEAQLAEFRSSQQPPA